MCFKSLKKRSLVYNEDIMERIITTYIAKGGNFGKLKKLVNIWCKCPIYYSWVKICAVASTYLHGECLSHTFYIYWHPREDTYPKRNERTKDQNRR